MSRWPHDNQAELIRFYGNPGNGEVARQLVPVVPPFRMYYDGKPIKAIQFHRKAAQALSNALEDIWDSCGHDQAKVDHHGISKFAGSFNPRMVRGSATKWSNHAFGAAIDLNAAENGLYAKGNMPDFVVAAFERQGARWGGNYKGRKDPMHFEFCDNGKGDPVVALTAAPHADGHVHEEPEEDAKPKSMATSKIGTSQVVIGAAASVGGVAEIKDAVNQTADAANTARDLGVFDVLSHLSHQPFFWVFVVIAIAAGAAWYWRRQHRQAGV